MLASLGKVEKVMPSCLTAGVWVLKLVQERKRVQELYPLVMAQEEGKRAKEPLAPSGVEGVAALGAVDVEAGGRGVPVEQ